MFRLGISIFLAFCLLLGQSVPTLPTQVPGRRAMTIGMDDTVTISAFHCEEISKAWQVGSSGYIDLPMVGRVQAAGRTVEQLEAELKSRLAKFLEDPIVSVVVSEFRSSPVTVTGAVEQSGVKMLQGSKTVFEAVMLAGGLKPTAAFVTLTRRKEQGEIPHLSARATADGNFWIARFPVGEIRDGRGAGANLLIQPDDVLTVEVEPPKLIHVIGEVVRPGSIELATRPTLSLSMALTAMGGPTRVAAVKRVIIRRINEASEFTEVSVVNFDKINKGKALDLELHPGHVVIVPSNDMKTFLQTASLTALNSGVFSGLQILARF